ncbi:MAG: hypothetical protein O6939_09505 [Bacteroidetes bacterium]|nr:hypothetical protein [Bacteroidota bacterium]
MTKEENTFLEGKIPESPKETDGYIHVNIIKDNLDKPDGEAKVEEHHKNVFKENFGGFIAICIVAINFCKEVEKNLYQNYKEQEKKKSDIQQKVLSGEQAISPAWSPFDKATFTSLLVISVSLLIMSGANIYTNVIGSGEIIYIETPELALVLCLLPTI